MSPPPLRYLIAADVIACMPSLPERLRLAERTLVGLVEGAELPPKIGVHPRPAGSFAHAMPAYLPGPAHDGSLDLVGLPDEAKARRIPPVSCFEQANQFFSGKVGVV